MVLALAQECEIPGACLFLTAKVEGRDWSLEHFWA